MPFSGGPAAANSSPSYLEGSLTPPAGQSTQTQTEVGRDGANKGLTDKKQKQLSEIKRRREANYFFYLLNSLIPHDFHMTAMKYLNLDVLSSNTNNVRPSMNTTVTMAFLFIKALKKRAVHSAQLIDTLQDRLKTVSSQIVALGAGNQHPGMMRAHLARLSSELSSDLRVVAETPMSSETMRQHPGLQNPTNGSLSTPAEEIQPCDAGPDPDVDARFEESCFEAVLQLGLAYGAQCQADINDRLTFIHREATKEVREESQPKDKGRKPNIPLPPGLETAGMNRGSGGKRGGAKSGVQSG